MIVFHDPGDDLERRAASWGHQLPDHGLVAVSLFAAALAATESQARESVADDVAARAYAERRHLIGDRIVHWAVPWLSARGREELERDAAEAAASEILAVGERLRPAPSLTEGEGLYPPGEDSYGPVDFEVPLEELVLSLWSGAASIDGSDADPADAGRYDDAGAHWRDLAAAHDGTRRFWQDLATRAARTAAEIRTSRNP